MRSIILSLSLLLTLIPVTALAHAPIKGINNFYNGILHPLVVAPHLMIIIALGLLIGQQSKDITIAPRGFLGGAIAGLAAAALGAGFDAEIIIIVIAGTAGLLASIKPSLKTPVYTSFAIMGGLFIGLDSTPEGLKAKDLFMSLGGTLLGASLLLFYIAVLASKAKKQWQQIGVRVIASWTTASAVLVLALQLIKK